MRRKIAVLGSTGSIGTQALDVIGALGFEAVGLAAGSNLDLLEKQIRFFKPAAVSVATDKLAAELGKRLRGPLTGIVPRTEILWGPEGVNRIASMPEADTVVIAITGLAAIGPVFRAAAAGRRIAMANKEVIVAAGSLLQNALRNSDSRLIPVDSEQSAIFQCISGNKKKDISRIMLMASGGPFRGMNKERLQDVAIGDVLKHPVWKMGRKITVDSATLMNKGLEVIECRWLFDVPAEKIEVMIHPQTIIHSMVEYRDGSVMAQLAKPDMRLPIQYSLTWPYRLEGPCSSTLGIEAMNGMHFEKPDFDTFPCLQLAYDALNTGGTAPAVMNAANESAVAFFLEGKIGFTDIPVVVSRVMDRIPANNNPDMDDIIEVDRLSRRTAEEAAKPVKRYL